MTSNDLSTQRQARALGDPTRHRIFRYLADSDGPVDVGELTAHLGLNHNAIRQHLAKLIDAGLVVQATAPARGRGRPRLLFELNASTHERWGGVGPYQRLSLLLVEMLRTGDSAIEVGRRAGHQIELDTHGGDPIAGLGQAMTRSGFDPALVSSGHTTEFVLGNCPFADTATADPATICALHLGLAQGMADQLEGVVVDDLEPHDPIAAGCRLRLHVGANEPTPVVQ